MRGIHGSVCVLFGLSGACQPEAVPGGQASSWALGYPGATLVPAYAGNYRDADRGPGDIHYIIVHATDITFDETIAHFQDPAAEVSAHYVIRSADGYLIQMVDDTDIAWHDACFNTESIGVEHEGDEYDPGPWYTEEMYAASARLVVWLADTYEIPIDRAHIMGHGEAPDCSDHTDPGPGWDWDRYFEMIEEARAEATGEGADAGAGAGEGAEGEGGGCAVGRGPARAPFALVALLGVLVLSPRRRRSAWLVIAWLAAACGPPGHGHGEGVPCGDQTCEAGDVCMDGHCLQCDPRHEEVCRDTAGYVCKPDGTLGPKIQQCGPDEQCFAGTCLGAGECANGTELIYVVDDSSLLLSFDPSQLGQPFQPIGTLDCLPQYPAWPNAEAEGSPPTPFSMSVDRRALAWVLYSSGEIFLASTVDASCQATPFQRGQQGFEVFGMGFVSDAPGSSREKLFIAGGAADQSAPRLGWIGGDDLSVTPIAGVPAAEHLPELTGTGAAELYGYYPGVNTFVALIDRATATNQRMWQLPALFGATRAWAFAQWGGVFWIFITSEDPFTGLDSQVYRLDPVTGSAERVLDHTPYIVVGAGVSTCAPVMVD